MTRRTALVTGASALFLAACGKRPARVIAGNPADIRILNAALDSERGQIAFFEDGTRLSSDPIVATILAHQRAHAAAIEEAIRELGGTPNAPTPIRHAGSGAHFAGWRRTAVALENQWSAGYAAVIPKLVNPRLRSTFGALMTTEAEHAVALDLIGR